MARRIRIEYAGAIYHVLSRGDRREEIFRIDEDRARFLSTLGEACEKSGWQVHAVCLMPNHFHLVMETPRGNLVAGMKWFLGTYTARFNRRHGLTGHLFAGRYKAIVVDGRGSGYLRTVCTYVHLNPARAGLLRPAQPLQAYRWSSYPWYVGPTSKRPTWLNVDRVLGEEGLQQDTPASRRQFAHRMEVRRAGEDLDAYTTIRCGWCVGDQDFRVQLLDQLAPRFRSGHYGPERDETEERRAERIVREELRKRRATEADLRRWPKGAAAKVQIAQALRRATTMPQAWIARRLHAGSPTYLYNRLYLLRAGRRRVVNNRD